MREAAASDAEQILLVERAAFGGSEEAEIVRAVRDLEGSFGLVAEEDGAVVGHVQLSRAWIGSDPVLALGPIGVLPARQGRGIGSALVEAALAAARERHEIAVILLGSQEFYPRFGFLSGFEPSGCGTPFTGVQEDGVRRGGRGLHGGAARGPRLRAGRSSTVAPVVRGAG